MSVSSQAQRTASSGLASLAGQELSGERGLIDRAAKLLSRRMGAAQNLAGSRQQRAASELAASRGLAGILGQGAQQRYGAGQQVAGQVQQAAGQKAGGWSRLRQLNSTNRPEPVSGSTAVLPLKWVSRRSNN